MKFCNIVTTFAFLLFNLENGLAQTTLPPKTIPPSALVNRNCHTKVLLNNKKYNLKTLKYMVPDGWYDKDTYLDCLISDVDLNKDTLNINMLLYCGNIIDKTNNLDYDKDITLETEDITLEINNVFRIRADENLDSQLCLTSDIENSLTLDDDIIIGRRTFVSGAFGGYNIGNNFITISNISGESPLNESDCSKTVTYKFKIEEIFNEYDISKLCIDNEHNAKIKQFIIPRISKDDPSEIFEEDHCSSTDAETYSKFRRLTFNTNMFVNYMGNLCRLEIVSEGPENNFSVNPIEMRIQVNGYIRCSNNPDNPVKIRIEGLKGPINCNIYSNYYSNGDFNHPSNGDFSFFSNYLYTVTEADLVFAMIPDIKNGETISPSVTITFYGKRNEYECF